MLGGVALLIAATLAPAPPSVPPEVEIEAPGPAGPLRGTMRAAGTADAPVVLIVPGSGPTDRDGNSPQGLRAAPYRLLAEALAERGIATVRIDKRGMFGSSGAVPDPNAVTIADYARDIAAWIGSVRGRTGASCVWLLGHSEGGLVALAAAQETQGICGLLLVATLGRPADEVIAGQLRAGGLPEPLLSQALSMLAELKAGRRVEDVPPALAPLFAPQVQGFVADLVSHDPAALAARVERPMLVLHGGRDLQVTEEDARRLASANPKAELVVLPYVNHVLKEVREEDRMANLATYGDPAVPLAPGVAETIAGFVAGR